MEREEALSKMIPPGAHKPGKWREGVIQIWVTRACDKSCFGCTQGSNLRSSAKENMYMSVRNFETAVQSLVGYHGVIGIFGGNPVLHPNFETLCEILTNYIPYEQRGIWCNNPIGKGKLLREVFNPVYSNLNVHLDQRAYDEFKRDWPESRPVGLYKDSRHSPVHGSMMELKTLPDPTNNKSFLPNTKQNRWEFISNCDINHHWSGMIGQFRSQCRAWFCEIAGAQSMLMQDVPCPTCKGTGDEPGPDTTTHHSTLQTIFDISPDDSVHLRSRPNACTACKGSGYLWPDTGVHLPQEKQWWRGSMQDFGAQVDYHCHRCLVPLRGYGELACASDGIEQTTPLYLPIFNPKKLNRKVSIIETHSDLTPGRLKTTVDYLGNSTK